MTPPYSNPFRPGAGQFPPYLAGRSTEKNDFQKLLLQRLILQNLVITGLRGVGKTVLLDELKSLATKAGWIWVGTDLSESASVSEQSLATRILVDMSVMGSSFVIGKATRTTVSYKPLMDAKDLKLDYNFLSSVYNATPGLASDKLKKVLEVFWDNVHSKVKGVVLCYDEAQLLKDSADSKQYPLSLLLEVIQYLQKKKIAYLLVLTGLPTLYPNLVEARTYSERMFKIMTIGKLSPLESKLAVETPLKKKKCPVVFSDKIVLEIVKYSSGYPYFIQFFCRETFDLILQHVELGVQRYVVSIADFVKKLDIDFYSGRWSRITDRQRELLGIIAKLPTANDEFTVKEIVQSSQNSTTKPFKPAHINNLMIKLTDLGLIYKNRRSKYSFAVPLLADYIKRQGD